MLDDNQIDAEPHKVNVVIRISAILSLIVMVVSSFMYIPEGADDAEIFAAISDGINTGFLVLVSGWVVSYFTSRNRKSDQE